MQERVWLIPSIVLTLLAGVSALCLIPTLSGLMPALWILPAWTATALIIACAWGFVWLVRHKIDAPLAHTRTFMVREWRRVLFTAAVVLLAGLNMIAFMWTKPLLNYLVPFWADPLLADADRFLFLGHEPWELLQWANFPAAGLVYHPGWFALTIMALLIVAASPPSPGRSAVLLGYFLLWSVIGPLIHIALPAAGPVFYERMGYGSRFATLSGGPETAAVADYLWAIYSNGSFGAGSGISAMPSMHVTISSWIVIAFFVAARRWAPLALAAWLAIFLLSIALGWHYALDGIVGAAAALTCHLVLLKTFKAEVKHAPAPGFRGEAAAKLA